MNPYWLSEAQYGAGVYFDIGAILLVINIALQMAGAGKSLDEAIQHEGQRCGYNGDTLLVSLIAAFVAWPLGVFRSVLHFLS